MTLDLRYYLSIFLRKLPLFLLVAGVIGGIGIAAALTLPPAYVSSTQLVIEPPQIPEGMTGPTVDVSPVEQLELFQTRLMTRSNLLAIARKLNVLEKQDQMNADQIVQGMNARTSVRRQAGRNKATIMTLRFEARSPRIAAAVLNEYLTLILQQDATNRTQRASQTQDFFAQEVQRLNDELGNQSARILEFKNAHSDALPEGLDYNRGQQLSLQRRISENESEIATLNDQKNRMAQMFESTGRIDQSGGAKDIRSPAQKELDGLKNDLSQALLVYSAQNPRVQLLQRRIAQMEKEIAQDAAAAGGDAAQSQEDPARTVYNLQVAEIDSRIEALTKQKAGLETQLATISDNISQTPGNALTLSSMQRDYENLQSQYNTAVARQAQASTGERVALLSRGERVTVIEQPSVPSEPSKPDRKKLAAAGVGLGLAAGLGLIVLLELLNGTARRPADLVTRLGFSPIATIPYLRTRREVLMRRLSYATMVVLVLVAVPAALAAVHYYYQPLDLLADRLMSRFGLRG